jgi:hypothetical protein
MKSIYRALLFFSLMLAALATPTLSHAGEIQVRGGTNFAHDINSGDTTPTAVDDTDFGTIAVGITRSRTFRIYNLSGSTTLFVVGVTEDSPAFSITSGGGSGFIGPNDFRELSIELDPTSAGTKTATVTIANDDSNEGNYTFTITAEATGDPEIVVRGRAATSPPPGTNITDGDTTPTGADGTAFGTVDVGNNGLMTVDIENTGTAQLVIDSITSNSSQFVVGGAPTVVGVGQTQTFTVLFTPTSFGAKNGTITIQNNDATEDPFTFAVSGTGSDADIDVLGGAALTTIIPVGDTTPTTLDNTNFGTHPAGIPVARTFRIRNNGNESLFITSFSDDSPAFALSGMPGPVTPIAAGATNDFTITLDATSAGTKTGVVTLTTNAGNAPLYTFTVTAEVTGDPEIVVAGRPATTPAPGTNITDGDTTPITGDGTAFGNVNVGGNGLTTIDITNTGTAQLVIDSITSSSNQFVISTPPTAVGVNQTQTFTILFSPTSFGVKNGTITIQNNDSNEDPFTFSVTGTGTAANIQVLGGSGLDVLIPAGDTTPSLTDLTDFGTRAVGNPLSRTFRISNTGNEALLVSSSSVDSPAFAVTGIGGIAAPIAPGNVDNFTITLDAVSAGTKTGVVTITSNAPNAPVYTFTVTAVVTGDPEIVVRGRPATTPAPGTSITDGDTTPAAGDGTAFGSVNVGGNGLMTVDIENTGTAQLVIDSITSNSTQFVVSGAPTVVGVNQTQTFTVFFTPTSFGLKNGTITIQNNDPNEDPFTFDVSGTGLAPDIKVQGGGALDVEIVSGDTTPSTLDNTDFGTVNASSGSNTVPFRIRNSGNDTLIVSLVSEDGAAFSLSGAPGVTNPLPAGSTDDFNITFAPTSAGVKEATVTIASNDPDEAIYTFKIRGEALGDPEIIVRGQATPASNFVGITDGDTTPGDALDGTGFGQVDVASGSIVRTFQIENSGSGQLAIDSITENSPHFSIASIPAVVGVNQTQTFTVTFNPTLQGNHTTTVTIQNNDADEDPFNFVISGTGLAPDIALRGGSALGANIVNNDSTPRPGDGTDFGVVNVTTGALTTTFAIRNEGNAALSILSAISSDPQFTLAGVPGVTSPIAASTQNNFTITFDPSSTGQKTAQIVIQTNDPDESPFIFTVTGFGGNNQPAIQVTGEDSSVFTNGQTAISMAAGTDFGTTTVAGGSVIKTFQINNTGTGALTISSVTESSPHFSITAGTGGPINPGDSASFAVTYDPNATGTHNATVTIASDATNASSFAFNIRGTGETTVTPEPEAAVLGGVGFVFPIQSGDVTPRLLDGTRIGNVELGSANSTTFLLRNIGTAPLVIGGSTTGDSSVVVTSLPASIPAGGSSFFTIQVTPATTGPQIVPVTIFTNDASEAAYTFSVGFEGIPSSGSVAITNLAIVGDDVQLTFTSVPGRTYRISATANVATGPWVSAPYVQGLAGDATPQTYTLIGLAAPVMGGRAFFRIEQE